MLIAKRRPLVTAGLALALFLGCAPASDSPASEADGPIINGQPVATDTLGVVRLGSLCGGCSGTLLMNDWVLTAAHCLNCAGGPGNITVTHGPTGFWRQSNEFFLHPTVDVALIRLPLAFAFAGGTTQPPANINNRIYASANSTLLNQTLKVDGYGMSTCFDGFGTLRTADLAVTYTDATRVTLFRNGLSQIGYRGDSGGPSWSPVSGVLQVAGVHSTIDHYCDTTVPDYLNDVGGAAFRNWVNWDVLTTNECAAGRGECDGDYATLCETTLASSSSNCGACGNRCASGYTCSSGQCVFTGNPYYCPYGRRCCEPGTTHCLVCIGPGQYCP